MLFWLGLVAGIIIGWIVEWIIDWRFWRRPFYAKIEEENRWRTELESAQREIHTLRAQAGNGANTGNAAPLTVQPDPLEEIKGIGPAFAQKLNMAGIFTFAQLSRLTPERVVEIVQPESWQRIEPQAWIAQAHALSQKSNSSPSYAA
jgi:predicted flap endonuclease-1-like 5' DNA nuclease